LKTTVSRESGPRQLVVAIEAVVEKTGNRLRENGEEEGGPARREADAKLPENVHNRWGNDRRKSNSVRGTASTAGATIGFPGKEVTIARGEPAKQAENLGTSRVGGLGKTSHLGHGSRIVKGTGRSHVESQEDKRRRHRRRGRRRLRFFWQETARSSAWGMLPRNRPTRVRNKRGAILISFSGLRRNHVRGGEPSDRGRLSDAGAQREFISRKGTGRG